MGSWTAPSVDLDLISALDQGDRVTPRSTVAPALEWASVREAFHAPANITSIVEAAQL